MVSVNTNVPARNAMPMMTDRLVPMSRRLCASTDLRASLSMARSVSELLHAIEHPIGGGRRHLVHDAAVGQEEGEVRVRGGDGVVGHHHDRLAHLADSAAHEVEDLG